MVIRSANLCSVPRLAAECTSKSGASPKKMTDEADFSTDADHFDGPLRATSTFYTNVPDGPEIDICGAALATNRQIVAVPFKRR